MSKTTSRPAAGISRGMAIALAATLALTAASYGIRAWREALQTSRVQASVVEVAAPPASASEGTPTPPPAPAVNTEATSPPALELNPANGQPLAVPEKPAAAAPAGLRQAMPAASNDAMQSRRAPPPLAASDTPAPPPPVALPPPSFRAIGRYADGGEARIIFAHDNSVIVAKRGDTLPDGFRLRTVRADTVVVVRLANQEKIELPLGNP